MIVSKMGVPGQKNYRGGGMFMDETKAQEFYKMTYHCHNENDIHHYMSLQSPVLR